MDWRDLEEHSAGHVDLLALAQRVDLPLVATNTVRFAHALRLVHAELCPLDYQLDPHEPTLNALLALYGSDRVLASAHPRRDPGPCAAWDQLKQPLTTALLFLPMIGCILISSNLSSFIGLRLGPRVLIAAGMLLAGGAMAVLTQVSVTSSYVSAVLPALLVLGLGLGLIFAQAINTATAGVAREDSGVASALVNTMQQVGGGSGRRRSARSRSAPRPAT